MVRTAGLEPAFPVGRQILSLLRLPFRHVRILANAKMLLQSHGTANNIASLRSTKSSGIDAIYSIVRGLLCPA
jgi:hypothetical protein